jgi:hypothetical protein
MISVFKGVKVTHVLALGFLGGNLLFLPMIAWLAQYVPIEYADVVKDVQQLFKDGMLIILGAYFQRKIDEGKPRE